MIFRNASQYIESLGKQFRAVAPLSRQYLIKTPDSSCQHQGVAGETEPVGFGVGGFGGGERGGRESLRERRGLLPFPLSTGRGGIGGSGRGQGQRSSPATGRLRRGKMIRARVVRKLRMVSRTFMIYEL